MPIGERKLIGNVGWLMLLQAVNVLLPFVTIPYVTRVFGVDGYGLFSIALNWTMYFQVIIEFGFNLSATKSVAENPDMHRLPSYLSSVIVARIFLVAVCFAIAVMLAACGQITGLQMQCLLMLFAMLLGIALQPNWLFQGLQDMKVVTVTTAIARIASVVLIFALVKRPDQVVLYAFLYSLTFVLSAAFSHWYAWRRYRLRMGRTTWRSVSNALRDGFPLFLSSAAGKVIGNVGVTVLGVLESAAIVGSYSAVLKIPQLVNVMYSPVSQALYPRVNELVQNNPKKACLLVRNAGMAIVLPLSMLLVVFVLLRDSLIGLLFGDEFVMCANALIPLSIWVVFGIVNNLLGVQLLIPFGGRRMYSVFMVLDAGLAITLCAVLGVCFGYFGVAVAVVISEAFLTILLAMGLLCIMGRSRFDGGAKEKSLR